MGPYIVNLHRAWDCFRFGRHVEEGKKGHSVQRIRAWTGEGRPVEDVEGVMGGGREGRRLGELGTHAGVLVKSGCVIRIEWNHCTEVRRYYYLCH